MQDNYNNFWMYLVIEKQGEEIDRVKLNPDLEDSVIEWIITNYMMGYNDDYTWHIENDRQDSYLEEILLNGV